MTMSGKAKPAEERSHSSVLKSRFAGTSRWEISIVPQTTFAQRMQCISVSPRFADGTCESFQKRPSRSGNAATEWFPVVIVMTRPFALRFRSAFSTRSTLGRSSR